MNRLQRSGRWLLACAAVALAGCASLPGPACTRWALEGGYCLQPTNALPPLELQQLVEIRVGNGEAQTLVSSLESDADGMRFVGLTPFGQKLVQIDYDNRNVSAPLLPDRRLDPTLLLAMMQVALWPAERVRAGLPAGLSLDEAAQGRTVRSPRGDILRVQWDASPWPHRELRISFVPASLELRIETLDDPAKTP